MEALEFTTHSDGDIIRIPPGHQELLNKDLRVIILYSESRQVISRQGQFNSIQLKTKNFKFSRDEANER
ncbi:MAG: hypothetical protein GX639_05140 [Fibrobacter sp.]|nr:hypothetical protein [Fibrobacter sp.]